MRQIALPHPHRPPFHVSRRAILALVVGAVIAAAVLVAALDDGSGTDPIAGPSAVPAVEVAAPAGGVRYDGGPEEGAALQPFAGIAARYDGGPDEGTRGSISGR